MATNNVYIWSNSFPDYEHRIASMAYADAWLTEKHVVNLEMLPLMPTFKAANSMPLRAEGLKPFRHGEIAKWN